MRWILALVMVACLHACAPSHRASFLPSTHGFSFANSFEGDPVPEFVSASPLGPLLKRGVNSGVIQVPNRFGLCGGMSAAVTDYWLACRPIPKQNRPPKSDEPLYTYLKRRQIDSFGVGGVMAAKFIEWMMLPERGTDRCTAALTVMEVATIRRGVITDGFAHIGLVYVDRTGVPWQNHQVLAYDTRDEPGRVTFRLYDPNFPLRDDVELEVRFEVDSSARELAVVTQRWKGRSRHVRGIFLMPYLPERPQ